MRTRILRTPAVVVASLLLGACSLFGATGTPTSAPTPQGTTAQSLIQDMTKAEQNVKSGALQAKFALSVDDKEKGENLTLNLALAGKGDGRDENNTSASVNLTANVNGKMSSQAITGDLDVDLMMVKKDAFVRLNKLTLPPEADMYMPVVEQILKKWYIFENALDQTKELAKSQGGSLDDFATSFAGDGATEEQKKQIRELFEQRFADIFDKTLEDGNVSVGGVDTRKISVKLNKTQLVKFAQEVSKINKKELSASDVKEMEDTLKEIEFVGAMYIGASDKYLYRITGDFAPANGSTITETVNFRLNVDITMSDRNKNQDVTAPIGAETFDPEKIMGALAPPAPEGGDMPVDDVLAE